jgi:hypothetical protein
MKFLFYRVDEKSKWMNSMAKEGGGDRIRGGHKLFSSYPYEMSGP